MKFENHIGAGINIKHTNFEQNISKNVFFRVQYLLPEVPSGLLR